MKCKYISTNKVYWDELTNVNFKSPYYDVALFQAKLNSLKPLEMEELGDVRGKKILHLQCHFGMDTISLARMGAEVVGVDFSFEAIQKARRLSEELNVNVNFICSDVQKLDEQLINDEFDIVFASYGVLAWLRDLNNWARIISKYLKKGGFFYLVDEHPFARVFCNPQKGEVKFNCGEFNYYWNNGDPCNSSYVASYAEPNKRIKNTSQYVWPHSMSEILNSLVNNGLSIEFLHEFDKTFYKMFTDMEEKDGWWVLKGCENKIPLMFSLKVVKK